MPLSAERVELPNTLICARRNDDSYAGHSVAFEERGELRMKLAFIGFGELGHYLCDTLQEIHHVDEENRVYFDDNLHRDMAPRSFPFKEYANDEFKHHQFYICLGYRYLMIKQEIITRLTELGRSLPHFIHSSSYVHPTVKPGPASFLYPGCSIDRNTVIGRGTWIANGSVIAHDCTIGDACWFGASVTLSGKVTVGQNTFIGSGSTVSNSVRIGSGVIVGLATAVTKDIADGESVIGNPMRTLDRAIELI